MEETELICTNVFIAFKHSNIVTVTKLSTYYTTEVVRFQIIQQNTIVILSHVKLMSLKAIFS